MKSFRGTLNEPTAKLVAKYRVGRFTYTCKKYAGMYFITFHNGRKSSTTRYTDNKKEANNWIIQNITSKQYKLIFLSRR